MITDRPVYAIVLAGGEGTRLRSLTTNGLGEPVPKQFCSFGGSGSLLAAARDRAAGIAGHGRVVVVVSRAHRTWWEGELADLPGENLVVQPRGRGTAAGLLLPLLDLLRREPHARVVVIPSDHWVEDEVALGSAFRAALSETSRGPRRVALLGITPDAPETDYGWILPQPSPRHGSAGVAAFVEKPERTVAAKLMERGALWNSFLMAGAGSAFLALFQDALPGFLKRFQRCLDEDGWADGSLEELYDEIPALDFSRDVLERVTPALGVVPVPACGWTDLGTPERARRCLVRTGRGTRRRTGPTPDIATNLVAQELIGSRT
jgi:mannose-1-phosphate guanylyltransferase